jgi:hypothetical protein
MVRYSSVRPEVRDREAISPGNLHILSKSVDNVTESIGQKDGYYANRMIRVRLPDRLRRIAEILRDTGDRREVDEFVASMNRAAEHLIRSAAPIFRSAVDDLYFNEREIPAGRETPVTDYFRAKTYERLARALSSLVMESMEESDVIGRYEEMVAKYTVYPFKRVEDPDMRAHLIEQTLDGFFRVLAEEEQNVRSEGRQVKNQDRHEPQGR